MADVRPIRPGVALPNPTDAASDPEKSALRSALTDAVVTIMRDAVRRRTAAAAFIDDANALEIKASEYEGLLDVRDVAVGIGKLEVSEVREPYELVRRLVAAGHTLATDGRTAPLATLTKLAEQLAGIDTETR